MDLSDTCYMYLKTSVLGDIYNMSLKISVSSDISLQISVWSKIFNNKFKFNENIPILKLQSLFMKKNDNFDTKSKEFNNFERKKMIIIQKLKDKAFSAFLW